MRCAICVMILVTAAVAPMAIAQDIRDEVGASRGCYAIQLGAFLDMPDALACQRDWEAQGYTPVWIEDSETWKRVLFGRFEYHVDAIVHKRHLRASGRAPEAFERYFEDGAGVSMADHRAPLTPVFRRVEPPQEVITPVATLQARRDPAIARIEELRGNGDLVELRRALTAELGRRPISDPRLGYLESSFGYLELAEGNQNAARAHFESIAEGRVAADIQTRGDARRRLGYLALADGERSAARAHFATVASDEALADSEVQADALVRLGYFSIDEGEMDEALRCFEHVANGRAPVDEATRVQARRATAWLIHEQGNRIEAYQAFREIGEAPHNPVIRAQCAVECVGLAMELAESDIGTHREMRRMAREAFAQIHERSVPLIHRRATLELMYSESFARQGEPDYETAARLGEEFIERYSAMRSGAPAREVATAMFQTGMYHLEMGDLERAFEWYERVLEEVPEGAPEFRGLNPRAEAMMGMSHISHRLGDHEETERILFDLSEMYPESQAGSRVQGVREHIGRERTQRANSNL